MTVDKRRHRVRDRRQYYKANRLKRNEQSVASQKRRWQTTMVRDARVADKKGQRAPTTVTASWINAKFEELQGHCLYCGCAMLCGEGINRRKSRDGASLQRIDNELSHTNENCTLCCRTCNHISNRHIRHATMLFYGKELKEASHKYCSDINHQGLRVLPVADFYSIRGSAYTYCKPCSREKKRSWLLQNKNK